MQESVILVTGGAGYVGSHTCKRLHEAGHKIVVVDDLSRGHEWALQWGEFCQGSLHDRNFMFDVFGKFDPQCVIHFAASIEVGESVKDPLAFYWNNVAGSINLLDAMRKHNVPRLVFSSTAAVYGIPKAMPICETAEVRPINPYGFTKSAVEQMLSDSCRAYGLTGVALRYFNACGADAGGQIGEAHEPETHVIPLVIEAARGVRDNFTIFGNDYDTPDGTCIRDYVHVSDLAEAHLKAVTADIPAGRIEAINLGAGDGFSVKEIIAAVSRCANVTIPTLIGERRTGDPAALVADITKAASVLGWHPKHSSIDNIVSTAWAWHSRND